MADQIITLPPELGGGKKLRVIEQTIGGNVVEAEVVVLGRSDGTLADVVAVSGAFWQATQPVSLSALPTLPAGTNVIGHVVVDSAPTTAVTGPLTDAQLRASTVPISGSVGVSNFPATQPVSGTVTVANPTANPETGLAKDATLPKVVGTWSYDAGVSGTVTVGVGKRVIGITATGGTSAASMTINGGPNITIPANMAITWAPVGQLIAPVLVFTSTASYICEYVQ